MAIWPFGRRKKSESRPIENEKSKLSEKNEARAAPVTPNSRASTYPNSTKDSSPKLFRSKKQSRTTSLKDEGRDDAPPALDDAPQSFATPPKPPSREQRAAPTNAGGPRRPLTEVENQLGPSYRREALGSKISLGHDAEFSALPIVPTLSRKQSTSESGGLLRRKSTKKRATDKQREEELRTSSPIPIPARRPLSDAGGLSSLQENREPGRSMRPGSQVSLRSLAESLYDEYIPDVPESTSYKVSAFDVLAPRPTIRYRSNPRFSMVENGYARREREPVLPQGDFSEGARMNELADGLDARELRELMDRDRRRRERKKKVDSEKLAKKLEKREKEKQKEQRRTKGKARERAQGDDDGNIGAAANATPVAATGMVTENPFTSPEDDLVPLGMYHGQPAKETPESPIDDPFRETVDSGIERDDAVIETARAVRLSLTSMSPPPSPLLPRSMRDSSGMAEQYQHQQQKSSTPDIPELPEPPAVSVEYRRGSETSSRVGGGTGWGSIFRRGLRRAKTSEGAATPSESGFSSTSRESFKRVGLGQGPNLDMPPPPRTFRRANPPSRTRSKFREELPDVPQMPSPPTPPPRSRPQSRMHSPDANLPPSPYVDKPSMLSTDAAVNAAMEDIHPALRQEVALSRHQSIRSVRDYDSGPSAATLSQSLASVDSEGSWLSGRPSKRSSSVSNQPTRASGASIANEDFPQSESIRSSPIMFGRRTSNPGSRPGLQPQTSGSISEQLRALRHPSQPVDVAMPTNEATDASPPIPPVGRAPTSSHVPYAGFDQNQDSNPVLHEGTLARSPTLVNRASHARSRQGLLDIFDPVESSATVVDVGDESPSLPSQSRTTSAGAVWAALSGNTGPERLATQTLSSTSPTADPHREAGSQQRNSSSDDNEAEIEAAHAETAEIKRATSVRLEGRGHARQMSAGSARLLDLPARQSGEFRGLSREGSLRRTPTAEGTELDRRASTQSRPLSRLAMDVEETKPIKEAESG